MFSIWNQKNDWPIRLDWEGLQKAFLKKKSAWLASQNIHLYLHPLWHKKGD
jgi:hypothetical protein